MKVLIVDDASIARIVLKDALIKFLDFKPEDIYEAINGREALQKYPIVKPDLVFLDVAMPDINGITVVKELMKNDPSANIIMCTSSSDHSDMQHCLTSGAIDYIVKPPSVDRVKQAYEKVVRKTRTANSDVYAGKTNEPISMKSEIDTLKERVEALEKEIDTIKNMIKHYV